MRRSEESKFKILLLPSKALHDLAPPYLCDLLTSSSSLSPAPDSLPQVAGLSAPWPPNSAAPFLSPSVAVPPSLSSLKGHLKTFLFQEHFSSSTTTRTIYLYTESLFICFVVFLVLLCYPDCKAALSVRKALYKINVLLLLLL